MRSFRVVHVQNIKGKAVPFPSTQFRNRTPSGAAKKAYSRMITGSRRHNCHFYVTNIKTFNIMEMDQHDDENFFSGWEKDRSQSESSYPETIGLRDRTDVESLCFSWRLAFG